MNNLEQNEVNMYDTVIAYSNEYHDITARIPNYPESETRFKNVVARIHSYAKEQQGSDKWINETKQNQEEQLIEATVDCSRKLSAFGRFSKNLELQAEMKITTSKMRQLPNGARRDTAMLVYDRAQSNLAQVADYGITTETQLALITIINSYSESIAKPGIARARKGQNKQLKEELFREAGEALANMDAGAEVVRLSEPTFYRGYRLARKIVNRGHSSLSLIVTVVDALTGNTIRGATIALAVRENGNGGEGIMVINITKKSAIKGSSYMKLVPSGEYTLSVTKPGYHDYSTNVSISAGERSRVSVKLFKK